MALPSTSRDYSDSVVELPHPENLLKQDPEKPIEGGGRPPPVTTKCELNSFVGMLPFWPTDPHLWFAQIEGQFALADVTDNRSGDDTKFNYVIAQLHHQYADEVKDIIINPPALNKYDKLKTELKRKFSLINKNQRLNNETLGNRKPSHFLRHLITIAGSDVPDEKLRTIWLSRLPSHVQTVITPLINLPLEQVAEVADRVYEISVPCTRVKLPRGNVMIP